ncbi:sensor histidine kinase [Deinococcus aestuarii]|uniref:sensor histidine kinase n=1 Tax=Deinococcus aestuarii TaxID=2774531 RepID=UPI001C0C94E3|nr:ATP-binding protein [Deinococcus aestuarii]
MLKAWGSELERQVAAQTRELRAANEELGAFAYTVSHDLRAPVRHVGSFAGLLRKKIGEEPGLLRYVDQIEGAATRMETLTDALLGLARTGAAQLNKTDVDLNLLVSASRSDLTPEVQGRSVTWRFGELPVVRADLRLLRQVLANLLGNAVKYSGGRKEAVVEVWAQETPREVTVAVRDNGAGFDPQHAGKLFGVFQRLHHQNEFEGTGVGLANVKRIVEKHGGRVWAEGRPSEGATFFFSLPRA